MKRFIIIKALQILFLSKPAIYSTEHISRKLKVQNTEYISVYYRQYLAGISKYFYYFNIQEGKWERARDKEDKSGFICSMDLKQLTVNLAS